MFDRGELPGGKLYRAKGCNGCLGMGYSGRAGYLKPSLLMTNSGPHNEHCGLYDDKEKGDLNME